MLLAILLIGTAAAVPTVASAAPTGTDDARIAARASYQPRDNFTATWKRADALKVRSDSTNTSPLIPADFPVMTDDVWIWTPGR